MASSIPSERQGFMTFNTWTRTHNIGHVSVTFGEKKGDQVLWQDYLSIQPKSAVLANPLIFLSTIPLKAQVVSFEEDCHLESSDRDLPRLPDYQYTFPATQQQIQEAKDYADTAKKQMNSGQRLYTYLPRLPIATRILQSMLASKKAFREMEKEPISGLPADFLSTKFVDSSDWDGLQNTVHSHCVTQARDMAEILEIPLEPERPFFVETPRQFNNELQNIASKMTGVTILETKHSATVEEKLSEVPI